MATLESASDQGVTLLRIAGTLNQHGVEAVETAFSEATHASQRVVIDLSQVDMVNTPAIAMFLGAHRAMKQVGGRLIFTGIQGMVEELLRRCRLDTVLTIVPDVGEAVEWARQ
jgi:stage II sporulation protein AA (anti-sigma F factor antagonist)